jgi:hypothetical protein
MTSHDARRPLSRLFAVGVATVCVAVVTAAQQPAPPAVDRAAVERQAAINAQPDTPGTGRFLAMKE